MQQIDKGVRDIVWSAGWSGLVRAGQVDCNSFNLLNLFDVITHLVSYSLFLCDIKEEEEEKRNTQIKTSIVRYLV